MNNVQILNYNGHSIRQTVSEDGEILFCAKDVAHVLEYRDAEKLTRLLDDDDEPLLLGCTDSSGREQQMQFVDECQLYAILLMLKTERTKPFRRWVTREVLPSIRKNGFYLTSHVLANLKQNDSLPVVKALASAIISSQEDLANMTEKYNEQCAQTDLFKTEAEQRKDAHARLVIKAARADRASQNHKNWESDARDDGMLSKACNTTYKFKSKFERMVYQEMFPKRNKRGFFALLNEFKRVCTFEWFIRAFHPELIPHKDQLELKFAKERHNGSM